MPFPFWANPAFEASAAVKTAEPATTSNSFFIFPPYFPQPNKASCGWNSRSGGSRQNGVPLGGLGKGSVAGGDRGCYCPDDQIWGRGICPVSQLNLSAPTTSSPPASAICKRVLSES